MDLGDLHGQLLVWYIRSFRSGGSWGLWMADRPVGWQVVVEASP
jgi:hypothetical protein